ncbi:ABC transporter ATP-binding protein [Pseudomonas sp. LRF_L74]|uniref:ABC transporter ATP-binding protein n=1 Tax=Pseudomonas sp. LRF_L74 TaxID=3369422 RepID=UPI003F619B0D
MPLLQIEGLDWSPHGARHWSLQDIALRVEEGEFVGLIGPNGSGKTSLLRCAYRANRPERGSISLAGEALWQRSARWSAQHVAVVLQEFPELLGLSVRDVVAMGRTPHQGLFEGERHEEAGLIERSLQEVGMLALADADFLDLSGGEKQRALLARALVQQPRLLILDEPTNHLDPRYQIELLRHLRSLPVSTLASFHDLNLAAAFCDRLYVLANGRLVAEGSPEQVLNAELLLHVFGVRALVDRHPLAGHPRITWIV